SAGRTEQQEIGALLEPAIACGERHHLRLADHRHHLEVEAVERFADGQSCFGQVTLDAAAAAIGDLMLGESGQEAGGWPTFLVRLLGEREPQKIDVGEARGSSAPNAAERDNKDECYRHKAIATLMLDGVESTTQSRAG